MQNEKFMIFFTKVLLVLSSLFFGLNHLVASTANDNKQYLTHFWGGDDEEVYLAINLSEELEFSDTYSTFEIENGQGCEITCKPIQANSIFSSDGHELKEIKLNILLKNTDRPDEVAFTRIIKTSYKDIINQDGGRVSKSSQSKREGVLENPPIDLTEDPFFVVNPDDLHEGMIVFKNALLSAIQ